MGSLCALSQGSQEPVRVPYDFHKGHAHDVRWDRADIIRVLEHIYAKPVETAHAGPVRISKPGLRSFHTDAAR